MKADKDQILSKLASLEMKIDELRGLFLKQLAVPGINSAPLVKPKGQHGTSADFSPPAPNLPPAPPAFKCAPAAPPAFNCAPAAAPAFNHVNPVIQVSAPASVIGAPPPPPPPPAPGNAVKAGGSLAEQLQAAKLRKNQVASEGKAPTASAAAPTSPSLDFASELQNRIRKRSCQLQQEEVN